MKKVAKKSNLITVDLWLFVKNNVLLISYVNFNQELKCLASQVQTSYRFVNILTENQDIKYSQK